jgi:HAD superfamily hydrolase (TIGR01459 family)
MKSSYANVREVADEFDAFVLDVWGVLHDGSRPYAGAAECLDELARRGKSVLLLSNTPSTTAVLVDELAALGFDRRLYTGVLASGEMTRRLLLDRFGTLAARTPHYVYVGPEHRRSLLEGSGYLATEDIQQAGFVLVTGLNDGARDLDSYNDFLTAILHRQLPLYCSSPDKTITTQQGEVIVCAGSLAARYQALGGAVTWIGKPHAIVYEAALAELPAAGRVVAIGDGLETDIAGARAMGLPALLLAGGIAVVEAGGAAPACLWEYCKGKGVLPNGILLRFAWE